VRIGVLIGIIVMQPMRCHPACRRILETADRHDDKETLEPSRASKAAVSQQPVIADVDADAAVKINARNQQHHTGPGKQPGDDREQGQRVYRYDGNGIAPRNAVVGGLRSRKTTAPGELDSRAHESAPCGTGNVQADIQLQVPVSSLFENTQATPTCSEPDLFVVSPFAA
jgi:hypothetical protein